MRSRVMAWCIDGLMVVGLSIWCGVLGGLVSLAYWLLRDGLFHGQSVGKRLMGLCVLAHPGAEPCTFAASAIRNVLWVIPVVNVVMGISGLYALAKDPRGRHWGDRLGNTEVVPVEHHEGM